MTTARDRRRSTRNPLRVVAMLILFLFLLAACGQKPGVHISGGAGGGGQDLSMSGEGGGGSTGGGSTGSTGGQDLSLGGESSDSSTGGSTSGGSGTSGGTTGGTTSGGTTSGGTTSGGDTSGGDTSGGSTSGGSTSGGGGTDGGTSGGSSGGTSGGQYQTQGSDRTGVSDDKIVLGIHAPVTGAAPLPVTSFREAKDLYWRWRIEHQKNPVLGRNKVEVLFRDDKYDPNSAVQVCRELAANAFHLTGGGGTDQIQACGQWATENSVPYFSAGVTEKGLRLPWYFAGSMTYNDQGPLLANFVANFADTKGLKAGGIATDTANFDDAVSGWEEGVQQQGIPYYKTLRHPKGSDSWYKPFARELHDNGVRMVWLDVAPVDYIQFAQQAAELGYDFQFIGPGITSGLNAVLGSGCPQVDKGIFLSPFPGLDWAREKVPDFFKAAEKFGTPNDDIALALWGLATQQSELFDRYQKLFGNDLTREDFRAAVEQQQNVQSPVYPTVSYSPDDHFGASTAHVIRADCSKGEHVTLQTFFSGF